MIITLVINNEVKIIGPSGRVIDKRKRTIADNRSVLDDFFSISDFNPTPFRNKRTDNKTRKVKKLDSNNPTLQIANAPLNANKYKAI